MTDSTLVDPRKETLLAAVALGDACWDRHRQRIKRHRLGRDVQCSELAPISARKAPAEIVHAESAAPTLRAC